jgi:two-component system alkaline phosphatase synthesis response regulator PhoP
MAYRILLAEDEESLRELIELNLELEGYHVDSVVDGKAALEKTRQAHYNLAILDVMLPLLDGFAVCESIRLENQELPIIFLTAKNTSADRVLGLKLGADDYLAKPFNLEELLLRVQALIKRGIDRSAKSAELLSYHFGENKIDFAQYSISTFRGETIMLTKKEIQLLKLLIDRKGEVVSRKQILEKVWGYDIFPSTRTIDNYILAFRKYFEKNPREPEFFFSIRSVGYKFQDSI